MMRAVGVNEDVIDQYISSSPHMMKKQMIENAEEMKQIFRELAPDLIEDGTIHLEIDHKSISKETFFRKFWLDHRFHMPLLSQIARKVDTVSILK